MLHAIETLDGGSYGGTRIEFLSAEGDCQHQDVTRGMETKITSGDWFETRLDKTLDETRGWELGWVNLISTRDEMTS